MPPSTTTPSFGSIPMTVLAEAIGHRVVVELNTGATYRGRLEKVDAESGNVHLAHVHFRDADGSVSNLLRAAIRGANVKWVVLPRLLSRAPAVVENLRKVGARSVGAADAATSGGLRKRPREDDES